ncbi:hypothetical protein [uncultured Metabacillus sp.]|uniref:hypothetical protein n=1 Tax=uncultured Metabacillus sp. TaxID=2860135 RepID=UPI002605D478|nr:hypothetical protein [uncultured Metabacillus sp.]
MIKKKVSLLVTGALVAGLVACNNNEAMDRNDENDQIDVAENVNYNGRDNVPFVRDVNDENEFRGMWDRDNRNQERNRNNEQNGLEISSTKTDIDSNKYPHTKAITVQDAKFKFVQADNQEEAQRQAEKYIQQFRQQAEQRARQFAQQGQLQRPQQQNQAQVPQQQPEQREQQQAPAQQQQQEQREQQQAPAPQQQSEQRE